MTEPDRSKLWSDFLAAWEKLDVKGYVSPIVPGIDPEYDHDYPLADDELKDKYNSHHTLALGVHGVESLAGAHVRRSCSERKTERG